MMNLPQRLKNLRNRLWPGTVILCFHRVASLDTDPFELAVSPNVFEEHMQVIRQAATPISLQHLVQRLENASGFSRCVPRRSVVVTIDDGYADNLHTAVPILQKYDIPVTLFLSSGYIGRQEEFWWDELERLLLRPGRQPDPILLTAASQTSDLPTAGNYTQAQWSQYRDWKFTDSATPTERHRLFRELHPRLANLPPSDRDQLLHQLRRAFGEPATPAPRPTHRTLTEPEVRQLAAINSVEIGAHTANHPLLPPLSPEMQRTEIFSSRDRLQQMTGKPIKSFAYPAGWHSATTVQAAMEAGFTSACTTIPVAVRTHTHLHRLPRLMLGAWPTEQFKRRLLDTLLTG